MKKTKSGLFYETPCSPYQALKQLGMIEKTCFDLISN